jgi:acetoin utilization protein AcuB
MNVTDIMTAKPVTVNQNDSLRTALAKMEQVGCRHLPVLSSDKHLVGIISDRDCRAALHSPHVLHDSADDETLLDQLKVRAVMSPAPITTEPTTSATEAARLMLKNHIGCLPVMIAETLVGIVTTSDILMAFINVQKQIAS